MMKTKKSVQAQLLTEQVVYNNLLHVYIYLL